MKSFNDDILRIEDLSIYFYMDEGVVKAVRNVSFNVSVKKTVSLLGESGCGKTVTARAILNLIEPPGKIVSGKVKLRLSQSSSDDSWVDIVQLDPEGQKIRQIRWKEISMIFQEPRNSLTPVYTVGNQIIEAITLHRDVSPQEAREMAIELLKQVGIPAPERRIDDYPHQLSGGMCQRVMIAMALACKPKLLIADEPTTALDVTIQAQVLELLKKTQQIYGTSILLITHDMGVVAEMADEVVVMYLGRVVEKGSVEEIFNNPKHPYTQQLFASIPSPQLGSSTPLHSIPGTVPDPFHIPRGCPFRERCHEEMFICQYNPKLLEVGENHFAACWLYQDSGSPIPDEIEK